MADTFLPVSLSPFSQYFNLLNKLYLCSSSSPKSPVLIFRCLSITQPRCQGDFQVKAQILNGWGMMIWAYEFASNKGEFKREKAIAYKFWVGGWAVRRGHGEIPWSNIEENVVKGNCFRDLSLQLASHFTRHQCTPVQVEMPGAEVTSWWPLATLSPKSGPDKLDF